VRTIAVANSKGGVGKTTLAVHLATGLAREGKRTLLVDLDPQGRGTASSWLLGAEHGSEAGAADVITAARVHPDHVRAVPDRPNLWIAPSTPRLAADSGRIANMMLAHTRLRKALEGAADRFDAVVIDTPPTTGFYLVAGLCAADDVIAPALAAYLSTAGLSELARLVDDARAQGQNMALTGVILFAVDTRESITAETRDALRDALGDTLWKAEVRVSTAAKALPAHRAVAWDDGADPRGLEDYAAVMAELRKRTGQRARRK
jgi:chromosome partitioning protein